MAEGSSWGKCVCERETEWFQNKKKLWEVEKTLRQKEVEAMLSRFEINEMWREFLFWLAGREVRVHEKSEREETTHNIDSESGNMRAY
jgi:fatty acid/phospholipid biosynthesis enzyme